MKKEEILAKAQSENNGKDVADLDAQKKGAYYAYLVGVCLIAFVDIVEGFVFHRISYGCNMAMFAMVCVAFVIKYRTLRKKHELIPTVAYAVGTAVWAVLWVLQLCGVIE